MLRELHISNLAVIEDATVDLKPGLNVFTGETGAGKSLVIGAFELLLGLRSGGSDAGAMVRAGCDEARVSGLFELPTPATIKKVAEIFDRALEPDEPLLITRRLFASGRSSVSVNGVPATAAMLRRAGQYLVDIHGQHDQQYLLKPSNQLHILDAFAQSVKTREKFTRAYEAMRDLRNRREQLLASQELRAQKLELYEFQADEIDAAQLQPGEFAEVQSRYVRLSNVGRIKQDAGQIYEGLYSEEGSAAERLETINKRIEELAELDAENLGPIRQQVTDATGILQDAAYELSRYLDGLDIDPGELEETQQRLDTLNRLIYKYARDVVDEDPIDAVLVYREKIEAEIESMRNQEADLSGLDAEEQRIEEEMSKLGAKLSEARKKAARKLKPLIETELDHLGMPDAEFDVAFETFQPDDENVGPAGLDRIEFMVRTNPGQESLPLRRIASGGEVSRIMLALKSILADSERISVLVFDEIDANIGGRLGSVIGRKMRKLAHGKAGAKSGKKAPSISAHQVLCITHLSQIAAFADHHLHIAKEVCGKGGSRNTRTTVRALSGEDRAAELAEMMAGKSFTSTALAQAKEMLLAVES